MVGEGQEGQEGQPMACSLLRRLKWPRERVCDFELF